MTDKLSDESHPIIIETWCKTNGCRADVYRQETRRLKDDKTALEQRVEELEEAAQELRQAMSYNKGYGETKYRLESAYGNLWRALASQEERANAPSPVNP